MNNTRVLEEWLFACPKNQELRYFERITDEQGKAKVVIGASLAPKRSKERKFLQDFVARGTRENQLFLTEAVESNVKKLEPLYQWFSGVLTVMPADMLIQPVEIRAGKEIKFIEIMGDFLCMADTGISGIDTEEEELLDFDKHLPWMSEDGWQRLENELTKGVIVTFGDENGASFAICSDGDKAPVLIRLKTKHIRTDGGVMLFDFSEESAGTQRIMHILPILADLEESQKVYVIDELDRKLHPLLSRLFVEAFIERAENSSAQLIFTTHEADLLDLSLLRGDEIWFVEKDKQGSSHLYSLSEFKMRPGLEIKKGYLQGRFGAIPFVGDINTLGWKKN